MRTLVKHCLAFSIAAAALHASAAARAEDANVNALVKDKILTCLHPTVNAGKATIETQAPTTAGDIATSRVKVFYEGMIKKNSIEMDVLVRASGSIRQFKVDVLSDTGMGVKACAMTKNWTDF